MKKNISVLILAAFLCLSIVFTACTPIVVQTAETTAGQEIEPVPTEVEELRGLWIATAMNINFPSRSGLSAEQLRGELDVIIETAVKTNMNAIFFQVRPGGDAMYNSSLFPTSKYLVTNEGDELPDGFDPLEYLVQVAHEAGIAVHAWVNPLRAALRTSDVNTLAENHPARLHPEYAVPYADGNLYFDAGQPAVRALVAEGVAELVRGYDIDGIIFDDYFYPYPKNETIDGVTAIATFTDEQTFAAFGEDYESLGDFRRGSINKMIEECYKAIKAQDKNCMFGVAPFGIWKNNDGENGGSDTLGMSSYYDIYCDPTAWVRGGYVDYLAPQIYWDFTSERAPYGTIVDWWNELLDGTGVAFYVSHAAYKYEDDWEEPQGEMKTQVEYARAGGIYRGSIFYGYNQIEENVCGISDELNALFTQKILYKVDNLK